MGLELRLDDRYLLEQKAGAGGMSTVYRARDEQTGRRVAVKILKETVGVEPERFVREIDLLSELSHPHIIRYEGRGTTPGGAPYLVMEWIEGETLAQRLEGAGLTVAETVDTSRRLAEALGAVHQRGVIHRDLKPANVLFEEHDLERVKLIDFGVARTGHLGPTLTRTGTVVGTFGFMAPEQARGDRAIDAGVDVFALGCLMYLCLTGRHAFGGDSPMAAQAKILYHWPLPPSLVNPEVSDDLEALVITMLSKEPSERPADGAAVAQMLGRVDVNRDGKAVQIAREHDAHETEVPATDPTVANLVSMVMIGSSDAAAVAAEQVADLRDLVAPHGGEVSALAGGGVVVTLEGGGNAAELASSAARCALAIRNRLRDAPMSLVMGAPSAGRPGIPAALIDRGSEKLRAATLGAALGRDEGIPDDAIEIDERMAKLLAADFVIERRTTASYLCGPGPRSTP